MMQGIAAKKQTHRPRLGFLGVGWIGRHRMEAIAQSGVAEVTAVVDPSPDAVAKGEKAAPGCQRADSFEELLSAPLDGIVIATPSAVHAEQSIRALERGMAVFCQKPLGRNARYGTKGGASFRNVDGSLYDFTAELFHGTSRQLLSGPP